MIRDECPGTAAALKEACDEHIGIALSCYDDLNDAEKQKLHDDKLVELEARLVRIKDRIARALEKYKWTKEDWKNYKPKTRVAKTRADELRRLIDPYRVELAMEEAAEECDRLRKLKANTIRLLNREKKFTLA
jgi:hypothetical protein